MPQMKMFQIKSRKILPYEREVILSKKEHPDKYYKMLKQEWNASSYLFLVNWFPRNINTSLSYTKRTFIAYTIVFLI